MIPDFFLLTTLPPADFVAGFPAAGFTAGIFPVTRISDINRT